MSRAALVMTHRAVEDTACAFEPLLAAARSAGFEVWFDAEETEKHGLTPSEDFVVNADSSSPDIELCIVLGGDGTILRALRRFATTDVPTFAMNFGEVGFLATVEPDDMETKFRRAVAFDFEVLKLQIGRAHV